MLIEFKNGVCISARAAVAGKKEADGPLGNCFDEVCFDDYFGCENWENAESEMIKRTICHLMHKAEVKAEDIQLFAGGDLCNQITSTSFGINGFPFPFLGLYNACATMAESLLVCGMAVDGGFVKNAAASSSSHFCTAERQYRTPLGYGGKRTPTAQWTVTGCGCFFVEKKGGGAYMQNGYIGSVVDMGIVDATNMGAAMAPAAAKTISDYLKATNTKAEDYDAIYTGDLGQIGSSLLKEILLKENIDLKNHRDCGDIVYSREQNVQAGGSGAGCSAVVLASHILPKVERGEEKNILFVATGALLSHSSALQGESIPSVAHLVKISHWKEREDK